MLANCPGKISKRSSQTPMVNNCFLYAHRSNLWSQTPFFLQKAWSLVWLFATLTFKALSLTRLCNNTKIRFSWCTKYTCYAYTDTNTMNLLYNGTINNQWETLCEEVYQTSFDHLGHTTRKYQDCFDEYEDEILSLQVGQKSWWTSTARSQKFFKRILRCNQTGLWSTETLLLRHLIIKDAGGSQMLTEKPAIVSIVRQYHHAVGREATKTASITWLLLSIYLSAVRVMSMSRYLCLSASGFSWWYLWTGDEGALSFCDQKTVGSREPASVACLVTSSWGVQSTGDSFWSENLP